MKLWYSFLKELKLSAKSYYFYIELFMAVVFLAILLFIVPENFNEQKTEYVYLNMPEQVREVYVAKIDEKELLQPAEEVVLKADGEEINATFYETKERKLYLVNSRDDVKKLAEDKRDIGAEVIFNQEGKLEYVYYLQGYESQRLKNLMLVFHQKEIEVLEGKMDDIKIETLTTGHAGLSDKENMLPAFLVMNGSIMGLFIIAAYIFLDKKEGIIKAYAVTASSVWQYLMSKVGVLVVTSTISSLIIVAPVMGGQANYAYMLLLLVTTGFFSSAVGLAIASFYNDIVEAFGAIYVVMMVFMIPLIAYFIPSWEPAWIRVLPAYSMLESFKEIILVDGDMGYVFTVSLGFLLAGAVIFFYANHRFKKTLTV